MFLQALQLQAVFLINRRRIKYAQKPSAYDLIHLFRQWRQSPQVSKSLSGGHNGIVVRYLLVIDIACLGNPLIGSHIQHLIRKPCHRPVILKAAYVLLNLLGHCRGQNPGIGSGVGDHLFLIQLLHHLKSLIRTDFKHLGTVVLKLRQVVKKGRILGLLFLLLGEHRGRERRLCRQQGGQLLCLLPVLKAVVLIQAGGSEIAGTFHCLPLRLKGNRLAVLTRRLKGSNHPVKGGFDKTAYLPLSAHHHSHDTGHDPAHGQNRKLGSQII